MPRASSGWWRDSKAARRLPAHRHRVPAAQGYSRRACSLSAPHRRSHTRRCCTRSAAVTLALRTTRQATASSGSPSRHRRDLAEEGSARIKEREVAEGPRQGRASSRRAVLQVWQLFRGRSQDALPATSRCDCAAPSCTTCTRSAGEHENFKPARRLLVNAAALVGGCSGPFWPLRQHSFFLPAGQLR